MHREAMFGIILTTLGMDISGTLAIQVNFLY